MKQLPFPRPTFWRVVLVALCLLGLYTALIRFTQGLGATTNLSDTFPWGLWVGFDILCGVALAAGGFTISAIVYVFNIERFRPVVRPAILTAFLGYLLVVVALMFDLGRPYRIWHPLVMWNPHSVMFEVGWCVTLYTSVLALEFSPLVFERLKWKVPLKVLHAVMPVFVVLGVLLSTLHQSSLGSFYLIVPYKLYPLWYSPFLPLFFFLTALTLGCSMTIVESFLSQRAFKKKLELDLLVTLGRIAVVLLAVTFVLRLQDLSHRGALHLAFEPTYEGRLFLAEMLLGTVAPAILLMVPAVRRNRTGLFLSALMIVLGVVMNRLNVSITGMERSSGVTYLPSLMEVVVTMMIVGLGFFAFAMAVKFLPIFPKEELDAPEAEPEVAGPHVLGLPFRGLPATALVAAALVVVGSVALGYDGVRHRTTRPGAAAPSGPADLSAAARDFTMPADVTFARGAESPGPVTFRHSSHVDGASPECLTCHGGSFPFLTVDRKAAPAGYFHDKARCGACHDGASAFAIDEDCTPCHKAE